MILEKHGIFDEMIEGIQIISPDWRYIYVNDTVATHAKFSKEELVGYTMTEKYPGIENSKLFETIQLCMKNGTAEQMINEFNFPDGSVGYFELRLQRIHEGVIIFSHDVTDQKVAEQLIKRTNAELEELIQLRTNELLKQKEIIENQVKRLEVLNNTKDKFFSIVAHDLKTPIYSMKSFSSLLIDHIESLSKEEIVHMSELFQISVDNTIKLADNLIAWARIQMNDFETIPQTVYVKDALSNIYELYKDVASKKEIEVSCLIEDSLSVFGDRNQVEFIIRNLVNNAIKYTTRGGFIEIKGAVLPNNEVEISISDNGVGISDKMKEKIFSLNKNQSRNGTEGETGTGLGLMLCYEFTKLNGGKIDIESEENKGTTFNIKLKSGA